MKTRFDFGGQIYVFWLIRWFEPDRAPTLLRCEEYQAPMIRLTMLASETGDTKYIVPFERATPIDIAKPEDAKLITQWLEKFGQILGYSGYVREIHQDPRTGEELRQKFPLELQTNLFPLDSDGQAV